ncbi:major facilitator superfamily domain-containing protein [Microdochium trichocladiopsis]|uniref:Major facilitator superfamily domain-containing protein n=1 Tax=Microdochium trichocladiopsis TaxID=1682393 RepID=A0A9P8YGJ6_9PEZI|nr:major facilitator superfamily domain-containing protein [Microdochium trichocladiopsis]KAH7037695.1 major facilitator superfamily domain-containing protein [Microdochium trichocladiopsis]
MASYGLSAGTLILFAGRLGDFFGHKWLLIVGNLWFAFFTLICGLCSYLPRHRYMAFLMARVLQGIGPALCIPNAVALLGVTYVPGPQKAMVFAIFGAMAPVSAVLSPLFAALLAMVWLPAAFIGLAAFLAFVALVAYFVIPESPATNNSVTSVTSMWQLVYELDLLGAMTGIVGLALFSTACNLGTFDGWDQPHVLILLVAGVLLVLTFGFVERHAKKPLLPCEAMSAGVIYVLAAVFCGWACFGIWIYYTWEFYSVLRGASPLLATAWHSPILLCGIWAALTTGFIIQRVGPAFVMTFALLAFTVGTVLIATAPVEQTYWLQTFLCNIIITWGMDLSFPAATLMLSDLVGPDHQGIAASLVTTVVNYSGGLALGIAGAIETWVHRAHAHTASGTDDLDHGAEGHDDPSETLRGYRAAWYLGIGLGVAGFIVSASFAATLARRKQKMQQADDQRAGQAEA